MGNKPRRSGLRVTIRDMIAGITIFSLVLALIMARSEIRVLSEKLNRISPDPHIQVSMFNPISSVYAGRFTVTSTGRFYPINYEFRADPQVRWKLIAVSSGEVVAQSTSPIDRESKVFSVQVSPDHKLAGGFYVIDFSVLDGEQPMAGGEWSVIRVAD